MNNIFFSLLKKHLKWGDDAKKKVSPIIHCSILTTIYISDQREVRNLNDNKMNGRATKGSLGHLDQDCFCCEFSVTGFGEISPLWQNFNNLWAIFWVI